MIAALLSNTPAPLLRASGVAGEAGPGQGQQDPGRDPLTVRDSQASQRAAAGRAGNSVPLTPEAVLALQESEAPSGPNTGDGRTGGRQAPGGDPRGDDGSGTQASASAPAGDGAGGTAGPSGQASAGTPESAPEGDADGDGLDEAEEKQVDELKQRDREVRAHEQAHARAGGAYAGAPSYTFQQGPDGKRYAVGGEVQIDTSAERTPDATIRKMQIVIRAATAPADPSSQDLKVAQQARAQLAEAQAQLRQEAAEDLSGGDENTAETEAARDKASSDGPGGGPERSGDAPAQAENGAVSPSPATSVGKEADGADGDEVAAPSVRDTRVEGAIAAYQAAARADEAASLLKDLLVA